MAHQHFLPRRVLEVTNAMCAFSISVYGNTVSIDDIIDEVVKEQQAIDNDEPIFVTDLSVVIQLYDLWKRTMPRVEPFYAVKVNDDVGLLYSLAALGSGFDCASKDEIMKVLNQKVSPDRIIYAHPCKHVSYLKYAVNNGVKRVTFDNEHELHKIKEICPEMEVILRIKTDDSTADYQMAVKFGCGLDEGKRLVRIATDMGLKVVGISFHVGSGCRTPRTFQEAILDAKTIFEYAKTLGIEMNLLDIGGGFPGSMEFLADFEKFCAVIKEALDLHFPAACNVRIVAEPGRYFSMAPYKLCTRVIAKRKLPDKIETMYYINDGKYGSFLFYPLEGKGRFRTITQINSAETIANHSSIWGPTCCGTDCVLKKCSLPELEIGDWMIFDEMGAYTSANASVFNGFGKPKVLYVARENDLLRFSL